MSVPDLSVFFQPNGVAVIGASRDPQKLGHGVVRNLLEHRYTGPIYPVNRRVDQILSLQVYPAIADVPDPLDLAVIVVPAEYVEEEIRACGERGVQAVIVISGGFREVGLEGTAREEAISRAADEYGLLLLGPNCIGTIDTHTPLNTTFVTGIPRPGEIACVSQSGAIAAAIIDWARGSGVGLSRIVSLGNQAGVTEAELLTAAAADGWTRVVTAYMEGVSDGQKFIEIASEVAQKLPVVVLKVGRGSGGAKAVASHTGALAGDEAAYDAAFRRSGLLRADTLEEMLDWARALAWQPLPRGNRVAILTNAGGPGVIALDALEDAGLELAPLTEQTRSYLRQRVFPAASVNNPVDVLAGAGPGTYAVCLDALLADETVDAVIVAQAPQDWFEPISLAEVIGEVANSALGRNKPVLSVIMGLASTSEANKVLHRRKIPNFAFPARVGSTLGAMWQRKQWLDSLETEDTTYERPTCDTEAAMMVVEAGLAVIHENARQGIFDQGWMQPDQVAALLDAYCVPTPKSGMAPNVDQAVMLAESIGYPVALKLAAVHVTHKTDVGGVALNITAPEELRDSFEKMMLTLKQNAPDLTIIDGMHVQQMVNGLTELIVGVVRDAQFGPLVMAGTGGTNVELARDVAFELAPLSRQQASRLIDRTAAGALLDGFRGQAPSDREAVIDVILSLSEIALNFPQIAEVEINPLIVMPQGEGAYAVDARLRLAVDGKAS